MDLRTSATRRNQRNNMADLHQPYWGKWDLYESRTPQKESPIRVRTRERYSLNGESMRKSTVD